MRKEKRKVMAPKIIFEDECLLVVDKPSGMVVNRAETTAKIVTVQDWVEKHFKIRNTKHEIRNKLQIPNSNDQNTFEFRNSDFEFIQRSGIVHRLDKETSGLLLIAKTPEAFLNLQAQFKNREVKKKYLTLVHGKVIPEVGEINAPVGRLPWNRERFGVMPGGREAVTRYRVINYFEMGIPSQKISLQNPTSHFSLLEIQPTTGRTHQIRIHLQYLGFPIVGDAFYAGRKRALADRKFCRRVFLHASSISFKHPKSEEMLEFNSPLPLELENILGSM